MRIAEAGLIGTSLTNSSPLVAPTRSKAPLLGTNPIAVAAPAGRFGTFCLDMATSTIPRGRIEVAARRGETIPEGLAIDRDGYPTTDPDAALEGSLLPLGGLEATGGYKGYGLALVVDLLTGVLGGATFGPHIIGLFSGEAPSDLGQSFWAIDPDAFGAPGAFAERLAGYLEELTHAELAPGAPGSRPRPRRARGRGRAPRSRARHRHGRAASRFTGRAGRPVGSPLPAGSADVSDLQDVCIIGGGIVGLATAYRLLEAHPDLRVTILEKESELAQHQSGHNSGVMHAGLYYAPGSLKARLCREGKQELEAFADAKGIPYRHCGKLVVVLKEDELPRFDALVERATANGVPGIEVVGPERIKEIEPHAAGIKALWSPTTGIIDYRRVSLAIADEVRVARRHDRDRSRGPRHRAAPGPARAPDRAGRRGRTQRHHVRRAVVRSGRGMDGRRRQGCAAHRPLPGRLLHVEARGARPGERADLPRARSALPLPRGPLHAPHRRRGLGRSECGARLQASGLSPDGISRYGIWPARWPTPASSGSGVKYWRMGMGEMWRDWSKRAFVADMQRYVPEVSGDQVVFGPSGVRAQALSRDGSMVDDFDLAGSDRVLHVRNAPSPAATACFSHRSHPRPGGDEPLRPGLTRQRGSGSTAAASFPREVVAESTKRSGTPVARGFLQNVVAVSTDRAGTPVARGFLQNVVAVSTTRDRTPPIGPRHVWRSSRQVDPRSIREREGRRHSRRDADFELTLARWESEGNGASAANGGPAWLRIERMDGGRAIEEQHADSAEPRGAL